MKAVRRHAVSALPECLEEAVQLALRTIESVFTLGKSMATHSRRAMGHSTQRPLRV